MHGRASRGTKDNGRRRAVLEIEWRIVAMQRNEGVQEYISHVREEFVVKVVKFGE